MKNNQPFFARRGDSYIPNPVSNGPWDPNSMHGRVVIGLLAHAIEERHGSDQFVPARLTVDMIRHSESVFVLTTRWNEYLLAGVFQQIRPLRICLLMMDSCIIIFMLSVNDKLWRFLKDELLSRYS